MQLLKGNFIHRVSGIARGAVFVTTLLLLPVTVTGGDPASSPENRQKPRSVLVLPFQDLTALYGSSRNIRSPITGRVFISGPVDEKALGFLNARLEVLLLDKDAYALIPAERATDIFMAYSGRGEPPLKERALWQEVGRTLGADAVLGGFVYRFKNRTGRDYGVDDAASVAFDLHLVRVRDGSLQWSGRVDETQQPLSHNLFKLDKFISRGGKWVTARELALGELRLLIADMPGK